jgi:hypothetical protein
MLKFKFPDSKIKILNNISWLIKENVFLLRDQTDLENNFNSNFIRINSTQSPFLLTTIVFRKSEPTSQIESIIYGETPLKEA